MSEKPGFSLPWALGYEEGQKRQTIADACFSAIPVRALATEIDKMQGEIAFWKAGFWAQTVSHKWGHRLVLGAAVFVGFLIVLCRKPSGQLQKIWKGER
jgi:hypothetical protein